MIVTTCHFNRPAYSKRWAESLCRVRGIGNATIIACIEPSEHREEIVSLIQCVPCDVILVENRTKLGCGENTLQALSLGFDYGSFVVHVEDDVLLGADALEMFTWMNNTYRDDREVFTVTAWNNRQDRHHAGMFKEVGRDQWFSPWGWGTWEDRFVEIKANWGFHPWDIGVNKHIRKDRYQVYPVLGRAQNIGAEGGTYCPGPEWHAEHQHCRLWVEDDLGGKVDPASFSDSWHEGRS